MSQYIGIADAYGLESFIPVAEKILEAELEGQNGNKSIAGLASILSMRAQANRHRHAVVFRVEVDEVHAQKIKELLDKEMRADALKLLKKSATNVEVGKQAGMKKSWRLIPNENLDPYLDDKEEKE